MSNQDDQLRNADETDTADYERPAVEELEAKDGPAVTAAGKTITPK